MSVIDNKIFQATTVSWCIAQFLKMLIYVLTHKDKKPLKAIEKGIWSTGGMPSSHSAVVCSLTASVGLFDSISSNLFIFSLFFALVVLRDSLGVRRAAGIQAKALNNLGKVTAEKTGIEFTAIKEIEGHSPLEVVAGGILGIAIAVCFYFL
ncbi:MAG: divergent PAP2 family protein [Treponema sp.]|nr:divergent PAP2 family protein [Treponema sp.]